MATGMWITFTRSESEVKLLAIFLAQLIREGITFGVREDAHGWEIILMGGY